MKKATDELLKTHQVVNKVLEGLDIDSPRFPDVIKTLRRTFLAHVWFQDEILAPVLREKSLIAAPFIDASMSEHKIILRMMNALIDTSLAYSDKLESEVMGIRQEVQSHFKKEQDTLYPLAEKSIDLDILNNLGEEMTHHQPEIREVAWN